MLLAFYKKFRLSVNVLIFIITIFEINWVIIKSEKINIHVNNFTIVDIIDIIPAKIIICALIIFINIIIIAVVRYFGLIKRINSLKIEYLWEAVKSSLTALWCGLIYIGFKFISPIYYVLSDNLWLDTIISNKFVTITRKWSAGELNDVGAILCAKLNLAMNTNIHFSPIEMNAIALQSIGKVESFIINMKNAFAAKCAIASKLAQAPDESYSALLTFMNNVTIFTSYIQSLATLYAIAKIGVVACITLYSFFRPESLLSSTSYEGGDISELPSYLARTLEKVQTCLTGLSEVVDDTAERQMIEERRINLLIQNIHEINGQLGLMQWIHHELPIDTSDPSDIKGKARLL